MRKIALLIIMTICGLSQVHAQDFGVKAGYNYSTFSGETSPISTIEGLSGFYIGGLVELPISDVLSIQPELIFSRQGVNWKYDFKKAGSINNNDIRLDYLNIPVMAKVNLSPLFLQAGVQFGLLVSKPNEIGLYLFNMRMGTLLDKDSYNSFDFGVGAGLGFNLNRRLFVEARYTHSLTNVFDPNDDYFKASGIGSNNNNFKNAVLSIGLGMKF